MNLLPCPLCSHKILACDIETHLSLHLHYHPFHCRLCGAAFATREAAQLHFRGRRAAHPGMAVQIMEDMRTEMEQRLAELVERAWKVGGEEMRGKERG